MIVISSITGSCQFELLCINNFWVIQLAHAWTSVFYIVLPRQEEELASPRADIKFTTKQRPLLFTFSDRITLSISGTISAIPVNFVSVFWFHNGWRLTNTGNVIKHRFGVWEARSIGSLPSKSGVYEAILWLQTYSYFSALQFGCRHYASFVTTTIGVGNVILDYDDISLIYYGEQYWMQVLYTRFKVPCTCSKFSYLSAVSWLEMG